MRGRGDGGRWGGAYAELARAEFLRSLRYPMALLAGIAPNAVFGFIRGSILVAAALGNGGTVAGYDRGSALSYVWLGQALIAPIGMFVRSDIADQVRTGQVAIDLARPVDFQLAWLARDLGRFAVSIPIRGVPTLLIGIVLVRIAWPTDPTAYPLGLVSLVLATSLNFLLMFMVNLISLWTVDAQGYLFGYGLIMNLLSGFYVPIYLFSGWLATACNWLPFPSILQTPVDVLSGRVTGAAAVEQLGVQALWLVVALLAGRLVWSRGIRRLVVQGG